MPSLNDPANDGWVTLRIAQAAPGRRPPPARAGRASSRSGPQRHLKPAPFLAAALAFLVPVLLVLALASPDANRPGRAAAETQQTAPPAPALAARPREHRAAGRRLPPRRCASPARPTRRASPALRQRIAASLITQARTAQRNRAYVRAIKLARRAARFGRAPGRQRDRPPVPRRAWTCAARSSAARALSRRRYEAPQTRAERVVGPRAPVDRQPPQLRWRALGRAGRTTAATSAAAIRPKRASASSTDGSGSESAPAARTAASDVGRRRALDLPARSRRPPAPRPRSAPNASTIAFDCRSTRKRSTFMPATSRRQRDQRVGVVGAPALDRERLAQPAQVRAVEPLLGRRLDRQARRVRALRRRVEPQPRVDRHPASRRRPRSHAPQLRPPGARTTAPAPP